MTKIAFLGMGNMGSAMALRALQAGHALTVWNRSPDKCLPLKEAGAAVARTPAEAVRGVDVVVTGLMDDASVRALFTAPSELLNTLRPGAVHLCVTTISPECADWLAAVHASHGSTFVSGPVLGRPDAVRAGRLVQFLAGPPAAVSAVEALCQSWSARIVPLGEHPSAANRQKLVLNFLVVAMIETMAEAYTLSDALGASRNFLSSFLEQSLAHPGLQQYAVRLGERSSSGEGGFAMTAGRKDVGLILDAARSASCPLELANVIATKMDEAIAQGMSQRDWSAIQEISRQHAGLDVQTTLRDIEGSVLGRMRET